MELEKANDSKSSLTLSRLKVITSLSLPPPMTTPSLTQTNRSNTASLTNQPTGGGRKGSKESDVLVASSLKRSRGQLRRRVNHHWKFSSPSDTHSLCTPVSSCHHIYTPSQTQTNTRNTHLPTSLP